MQSPLQLEPHSILRITTKTCINYSVSRFVANSLPVGMAWNSLENRTHPLAKHLGLPVEIDDVELDAYAGYAGLAAKVEPGPVVVLILGAVTVVLRPHVEFAVRLLLRAVGIRRKFTICVATLR